MPEIIIKLVSHYQMGFDSYNNPLALLFIKTPLDPYDSWTFTKNQSYVNGIHGKENKSENIILLHLMRIDSNLCGFVAKNQEFIAYSFLLLFGGTEDIRQRV